MTTTFDQTVAVLLELLGASFPPEEVADLSATYEVLRVSLDALYAVPMPNENEPQLIFNPLA